jgi:hypothetical protein
MQWKLFKFADLCLNEIIIYNLQVNQTGKPNFNGRCMTKLSIVQNVKNIYQDDNDQDENGNDHNGEDIQGV